MEKLFDAEWRLMEIIWEFEPISAKELSVIATERFAWNKNTTYTVIKRLIEKEVIKRTEPGFTCSASLKRDEIRKAETNTLIDKLYGGSKQAFFAAFADEQLSFEEIATLKALIEKKK